LTSTQLKKLWHHYKNKAQNCGYLKKRHLPSQAVKYYSTERLEKKNQEVLGKAKRLFSFYMARTA
jgi:hypothetical protein